MINVQIIRKGVKAFWKSSAEIIFTIVCIMLISEEKVYEIEISMDHTCRHKRIYDLLYKELNENSKGSSNYKYILMIYSVK